MNKLIQKLHMIELNQLGVLSFKQVGLAFVYASIYFAPLFILLYNYLLIFTQYGGVGVFLGLFVLAGSIAFYVYTVFKLTLKLEGKSLPKNVWQDYFRLVMLATALLGTLFTLIYWIVRTLL